MHLEPVVGGMRVLYVNLVYVARNINELAVEGRNVLAVHTLRVRLRQAAEPLIGLANHFSCFIETSICRTSYYSV